MRRFGGVLCFVYVLTLYLSGCSVECELYYSLAHKDDPRILAVGDSILSSGVTTCDGIPADLAISLGEYVEDRSVGGLPLTGYAMDVIQFYRDSSRDYDWVIVDGGVNDLQYECFTPGACLDKVDEVASDMRSLLTMIQEQASGDRKVILLGYYLFGPSFLEVHNNDVSVLNNIYEMVATEFQGQVFFLDMGLFIDFATTPQYYNPDNIHPSRDGARVIADELARIILANRGT